MSEFNTHGGYFAPAGYMKVEEGGSHEENPNGGVQIGVDPQGVPNMLEEGEPVYNDYVFSDNIEVTEEMAELHKLPKQIVGKLYSDAVQYFMDEAEVRPMDATSRNGLEAMLNRLADAQEEQKHMNEVQQFMDDLEDATPEELEEIAGIMSQPPVSEEEMAQQIPAEEAPIEQVPQEQMQMPIMRNGGLLHSFYDGGNTKNENAARAADVMASAQQQMQEKLNYSQALKEAQNLAFEKKRAERKVNRMQRNLNRAESWAANKELQAADIEPGDAASFQRLLESSYNNVDKWKRKLHDASMLLDVFNSSSTIEPNFKDTPQQVDSAIQVKAKPSKAVQYNSKYELASPEEDIDFACGGKMNKYDGLTPGQSGKLDLAWKPKGIPALSGQLYDFNTTPVRTNFAYEPSLYGDITSVDTTPQWKKDAINYYPVTFTPYRDHDLSGNAEASNMPVLSTAGEWVQPAIDSTYWLYNTLHKGDKYPLARMTADAPEGHINLQNQRFVPVDINMTENQNTAQENAVLGALRNSGYGASTPAAILAANYQAGLNRGRGFLQDWQANNQQRNAVIAANNQAEAQRAQFDYTVDAAKAQAAREAQRINIQNDLIRRRLENQSDQDYANAAAQSAGNIGRFLTAKASENRAYNMANSRRDLYDFAFPNGISAYRGNERTKKDKSKKQKA